MKISELYRGLQPLEGLRDPNLSLKPEVGQTSDFQKLLSQNIQLSQHAENRIRSRELEWNENLESRVAKGIDSAEKKGSKEALILADNVAVIANVKTRTIITAMDRDSMKDKIFTNIDSAVLV